MSRDPGKGIPIERINADIEVGQTSRHPVIHMARQIPAIGRHGDLVDLGLGRDPCNYFGQVLAHAGFTAGQTDLA